MKPSVPPGTGQPSVPRTAAESISDARHRKVIHIAEHMRKAAIESAIELLRTAPQTYWDGIAVKLGHRTVSQITKDGVLFQLQRAKRKGVIK